MQTNTFNENKGRKQVDSRYSGGGSPTLRRRGAIGRRAEQLAVAHLLQPPTLSADRRWNRLLHCLPRHCRSLRPNRPLAYRPVLGGDLSEREGKSQGLLSIKPNRLGYSRARHVRKTAPNPPPSPRCPPHQQISSVRQGLDLIGTLTRVYDARNANPKFQDLFENPT